MNSKEAQQIALESLERMKVLWDRAEKLVRETTATQGPIEEAHAAIHEYSEACDQTYLDTTRYHMALEAEGHIVRRKMPVDWRPSCPLCEAGYSIGE